MTFPGKVFRLFVSGSTILSFGLALASASLITGCGDSDKSGGQVETPMDPAKQSQDSMNYFKNSVQKKAKKGVQH